METPNYHTSKQIIWENLIDFIKGNKAPKNIVFYVSLMFMIVIFLIIFLNIITTELWWNWNSFQCTWIVTQVSLVKDDWRKWDSISADRYKCVQDINIDVYQGSKNDIYTQYENDIWWIVKNCEQKVGNEVGWYCFKNEFREDKNSTDSVIWMVFLLWLFIFAAKLIYNHQNRKIQ